ncbi:calmodulin-binding protein 25-like [Cucurbita maxima]|uniref:Calmodulin-binding protein 25-like n=1 Tax=Cucurbita maxima TaxID=3661 RepID=A0A6J1J8X4_CUCMA|nr:calmodulin-binding protein 25-like [Cucurbita maxima]
MASSDNFPTVLDPWPFRSTFQDPWNSDPFSRETQTLAKALHTSLLPSDSQSFSSFLHLISPESADPTPTVSAASDPDSAAPKRQTTTTTTTMTSSIPPTRGKISKRKSRASKKNHTTFITADPANFRQMVQQVTGVRFGNTQLQIPPVLKPEPQRPTVSFAVCGGASAGLPTLDTSAFLLNHHHHHQQQSSGNGSDITGLGPLSFGPDLGLPNNDPIGSDFDTFSSFPTLESWKAVI